MPIRGHSGVQGGAEMGAYATVFPGGVPVTAENAARLSEQWGFAVPSTRGMTTPEMIDAAHAGELDVLFSSGGNFLEALPDPDYVDEALAQVPLRVHQDIVLSSQMLVDPAETVVISAGGDPLRDSGRHHPDLDRAPDHVQPGDRRAADRRGAPGVGGLLRPGPPGAAGAGGSPLARAPRNCARRSLGSCRSTRALKRCARPAIRCSTVASISATAGTLARRTARPFHARCRFPMPPSRTGCSRSPPGAVSSSTRWSRRRRTRSPAPSARQS